MHEEWRRHTRDRRSSWEAERLVARLMQLCNTRSRISHLRLACFNAQSTMTCAPIQGPSGSPHEDSTNASRLGDNQSHSFPLPRSNNKTRHNQLPPLYPTPCALHTLLNRNSAWTSRNGALRVAAHASLITALGTTSACTTLYLITQKHDDKQSLDESSHWSFACWLCVMSLFHSLEFCMTGLSHPEDVTADSFLLNHSRAYHLAFVGAVCEYWLETLLVPRFYSHALSCVGLLLCLVAQCCRSLSMWQAGRGFTHQIRNGPNQYYQQQNDDAETDHQLVTHGLYAWMRHPSYGAWFIWSISAQLLLCNPLCFVLYCSASYRFFSQRIAYEEQQLHSIFLNEYANYRQRVRFSGVPFCPGVDAEKRE